jgi:ribonuclease HI
MFATIYTDASFGFVGSKATYSYSYYIRCDEGVHSGEDVIESCVDINQAEMIAIVEGVKNALEKFKRINRILVVTDSISAQYALWQGSRRLKYKGVVEEFRGLESRLEKIMIKWTKGHRIDNSDRAYLNNKCDQRANDAIRMAKKKTKN